MTHIYTQFVWKQCQKPDKLYLARNGYYRHCKVLNKDANNVAAIVFKCGVIKKIRYQDLFPFMEKLVDTLRNKEILDKID